MTCARSVQAIVVSRVKCGMDLVAATQCYRVMEIRYAFHAPLRKNYAGFDTGLPETHSGREALLLNLLISPERTMTGVRTSA